VGPGARQSVVGTSANRIGKTTESKKSRWVEKNKGTGKLGMTSTYWCVGGPERDSDTGPAEGRQVDTWEIRKLPKIMRKSDGGDRGKKES